MNSRPRFPTGSLCSKIFRVRIALIITELEPGGAEQCTVNLARFLARRGHNVQVLALGLTPTRLLGASVHANQLTRQLDEAGVLWSRGPATGCTSLLATVGWLRDRLATFQPDVIQSMLFHANVVTALANRTLRKPHFGGVRVGRQPWWRARLQRWASHRMHRVICVSQQVAKDCHDRERIDSKKLVVIPNGILIEPSLEAKSATVIVFDSFQKPDGLVQLFPNKLPPILLFVGRLSVQKGIHELLSHAESLLEALPEYHLVVLGDGPLREQLDKQVALSSLASRIHLLGWQPRAEQWMRFARVLLLPSQYEGMPNVLLEAMKSALPIVAFDVEGVRELLGESLEQIAASENFDQFLKQVHRLAIDEDLASRIGWSNRKRAADQFQLDDLLGRYERLYLEVLENRTMPSASTRC
jgi:glycosyltransferase involved in cell wall biosynthesis